MIEKFHLIGFNRSIWSLETIPLPFALFINGKKCKRNHLGPSSKGRKSSYEIHEKVLKGISEEKCATG